MTCIILLLIVLFLIVKKWFRNWEIALHSREQKNIKFSHDFGAQYLNLCFFPQAYSVYDDEIGYCPGQSFLAAVLLLHVSIWQE